MALTLAFRAAERRTNVKKYVGCIAVPVVFAIGTLAIGSELNSSSVPITDDVSI